MNPLSMAICRASSLDRKFRNCAAASLFVDFDGIPNAVAASDIAATWPPAVTGGIVMNPTLPVIDLSNVAASQLPHG